MLLLLVVLLLSIDNVLSLSSPLELLKIKSVIDYDTFNSNHKVHINNGLIWNHLTGNYSSTGRPYSAYFASFNREYFSFYSYNMETCTDYGTTSDISIKYNCEYATNGGFFIMGSNSTESKCEGNLVSDSYIVQIPTDTSGTKRANFGIDINNNIITGFMDNTTLASIQWKQLLTGNGWVVRNGESYVNTSPDLGGGTSGFCTEKG